MDHRHLPPKPSIPITVLPPQTFTTPIPDEDRPQPVNANKIPWVLLMVLTCGCTGMSVIIFIGIADMVRKIPVAGASDGVYVLLMLMLPLWCVCGYVFVRALDKVIGK